MLPNTETVKSDTQHEFRSRFAAVLLDLQKHGIKDLEAMWLIGSLANRLINEGHQPDWPHVKSTLTREAYDSLLQTFEREGNALHKKGNRKAAYAVQVISYSLIASKMTDELIVSGDELMDELISETVKFYNLRSGKSKAH